MSRNSLSWRQLHGGFLEEEASLFLELAQAKYEHLVLTRKELTDLLKVQVNLIQVKAYFRARPDFCLITDDVCHVIIGDSTDWDNW